MIRFSETLPRTFMFAINWHFASSCLDVFHQVTSTFSTLAKNNNCARIDSQWAHWVRCSVYAAACKRPFCWRCHQYFVGGVEICAHQPRCTGKQPPADSSDDDDIWVTYYQSSWIRRVYRNLLRGDVTSAVDANQWIVTVYLGDQ